MEVSIKDKINDIDNLKEEYAVVKNFFNSE